MGYLLQQSKKDENIWHKRWCSIEKDSFIVQKNRIDTFRNRTLFALRKSSIAVKENTPCLFLFSITSHQTNDLFGTLTVKDRDAIVSSLQKSIRLIHEGEAMFVAEMDIQKTVIIKKKLLTNLI